ncbi:hypothetical protein J6590_021753 [Homalodisca vitripennis]|nr:hypothetical protein J6590_021753 [Homalodisca vitripennis]
MFWVLEGNNYNKTVLSGLRDSANVYPPPGIAAHYPEPSNKEEFVRNCLYNYNYDDRSVLNTTYPWPKIHLH